MRKYKIIILCLITLVISLHICSCQPKDIQVSKSGFFFDTIVTITLYDTTDDKYIDDCFDMARKYEKMLSNQIADSEISKINNSDGQFIEVSDETIYLLEKGIEYSKQSEGKFDITIGGLSDLWDISNISKNITSNENIVDTSYLPPDTEIKNVTNHINYNNIIIKGNKVLNMDPESKIDLGAIAKGYIADRMKEYLKSCNYTSGIINLGGNIVVIGEKENGLAYNVGIQKPFANQGESILSIKVKDKSIVTSGIYERYFKIDNSIYHHILDPKTGYPCDNDLYSVTIISDKSIDGDALSTTVFLMGLDEGFKYIESLTDVDAIFIKNDYSIIYTSGIKDDDIDIF